MSEGLITLTDRRCRSFQPSLHAKEEAGLEVVIVSESCDTAGIASPNQVLI